MKYIISVMIFMFLAACDGENPKFSQKWENPDNIRPDEYIVLSQDAFGCRSLSDLMEALDYYNQKEIKNWQSIVMHEPKCFSAIKFKYPQHWVVYKIRGHLMQIGIAGGADYERLLNHSQKYRFHHNIRYWTLAKWGKVFAEDEADFKERLKIEERR